VTVGVDPARRAALSVGQPARLAPLAGGAPIMGHVLRIDSTLNPRTRMIDVDLAFPSGVLLPGEGVQAMIATGQVSGWVVPHKAVVTADGPAHLFQAVGGKAKAVPVRVTLSSDSGDVVEGALDPARPIIVDGAYQVQDGIAIRQDQP